MFLFCSGFVVCFDVCCVVLTPKFVGVCFSMFGVFVVVFDCFSIVVWNVVEAIVGFVVILFKNFVMAINVFVVVFCCFLWFSLSSSFVACLYLFLLTFSINVSSKNKKILS